MEGPILKPASWHNHFPYDSIRSEQEQAIDFTINSINNGKKYIILDLGTGVGKSAIGVALANFFSKEQAHRGADSGGYFLTTQKILQEQYIKDFGGAKGDMCSIKSASNYLCKRAKGQSCGEIKRFIKAHKGNAELSKCHVNCRYTDAKNQFMQSHLGVTNYAWFLNVAKYTEDLNNPRQILVLDEAHNIEEEISGFVDIQIDETMCDKVELRLPTFANREQAIKWIEDVFEPRITAKVSELEEEMGYSPDASIVKEHEFMDKYMCKLHRFQERYTEENWVMNQHEAVMAKKKKSIDFKPIDVSQFCEDVLYKHGQYVIFMSATILDPVKFAQSVGIPLDLMAHLKIESPFPPENKPVWYVPMGKMNLDTINATLPKIAQAVQAILKRHPNEKGIIHTHSFKILDYLRKNVKSNRLLFQDESNKDKIITKHIKSSEPTVLVSPSMTEGVDLKDDLSRFQVICKLPFPYLGDQLVQKRKEKWDWWYSYETAKTLIQAMGRSIRNENDTAVTYILDEGWENFFRWNSGLFPPSFHKQFASKK